MEGSRRPDFTGTYFIPPRSSFRLGKTSFIQVIFFSPEQSASQVISQYWRKEELAKLHFPDFTGTFLHRFVGGFDQAKLLSPQAIFFPTEKSASQVISISDRYETENRLANRINNLVAVKRKGGVIRDSRVPHAATSREWRPGGAPTND